MKRIAALVALAAIIATPAYAGEERIVAQATIECDGGVSPSGLYALDGEKVKIVAPERGDSLYFRSSSAFEVEDPQGERLPGLWATSKKRWERYTWRGVRPVPGVYVVHGLSPVYISYGCYDGTRAIEISE